MAGKTSNPTNTRRRKKRLSPSRGASRGPSRSHLRVVVSSNSRVHFTIIQSRRRRVLSSVSRKDVQSRIRPTAPTILRKGNHQNEKRMLIASAVSSDTRKIEPHLAARTFGSAAFSFSSNALVYTSAAHQYIWSGSEYFREYPQASRSVGP